MGKRITLQKRGKGSMRYRSRRQAFIYRIGYPLGEGKAKVLKLIHSPGHTAPLAKLSFNNKVFYNPAFNNMVEGMEIQLGGTEAKEGNILTLKEIPTGTLVYNIELRPNDGGKFIRTGGNKATVTKKFEGRVSVLMPSKREIGFDERCRATIGTIAGHGRLDKPFMTAGRKFYLMRAKHRLWPRTSAVKMNAVAHPFG